MLRLIVGVIIGAVAVLAIMGGSRILDGKFFVLDEALETGELASEARSEGGMEYTVPFRNDAGETVAQATIETIPIQENLARLRVNITHAENTHLDSLHLRFNTGQGGANLALRTPSGVPWPPFEFQRTRDGQGATFDVDALESQGDGSVTLDFLLGPDTLPDQVTIDASFAMHEEDGSTFQFRQQEGEATFEIPIP